MANKFRRVVLGTLFVVFAACVLAPTTALAGTLDQQQTDSSGGPLGINSAQSVAQTFTAGISGGIDQVDLFTNFIGGLPAAPLSVEIRDVSGGAPGSIVLASHSVPASDVSGATFTVVNFATPAPVVVGTQYAIVGYSSTGSPLYGWSHSPTGDPYAGGGAFSTTTSPPSGTWTPRTFDQSFKTYVVSSKTTTTPTGERAAAHKKCKHKHSKKKRKKCKKKASLLPV